MCFSILILKYVNFRVQRAVPESTIEQPLDKTKNIGGGDI